MSEKVKYVCPHCGGTSVEVEAIVVWDISKQMWEIKDLRDYDYCMDCTESITAEEAPLDVGDLAREAINKATTTR
jgi:hypothetical protein